MLKTASIENRTKIVNQVILLPIDERKKIKLSDQACAQAERELLDKANILSVEEINQVVKDIQEPAKRISIATKKVENAIQTLKDLNKQIKLLTSLIDVFSEIINAATSGTTALIQTLLKQIDDLTG